MTRPLEAAIRPAWEGVPAESARRPERASVRGARPRRRLHDARGARLGHTVIRFYGPGPAECLRKARCPSPSPKESYLEK